MFVIVSVGTSTVDTNSSGSRCSSNSINSSAGSNSSSILVLLKHIFK